MAKIKVTGDIVTLVSAITCEEFLKVKRYMPEAATMKDEDGNQVFKVSYKPLAQEEPMAYGVVYGAVDFEGRMFAQFDNPIKGNHDDPEKEKAVITDKYASIISKLNAIEQNIKECLPGIEAMEAEVSDAIIIEGGEA